MTNSEYLNLNDFANCYYGDRPIYVHKGTDFDPDGSELLFTVRSDMNCFTYLRPELWKAKVMSWITMSNGDIHVGIELEDNNE